MASRRFGGIEAGGTKFVVAVASEAGEIFEAARFDTTTPDETIGAVIDWLRARGPIDAVGIASFGPLCLDRGADNWGYITGTTKPGWSHTDFAPRVARALGVPVGFDTDVNGAALGEGRWGAAQGQRIAVYITIGTGIGGGAIVDDKPLQGLTHPEMGHIRPRRHALDADFAGVCPFHSDCLEGLASGPAIKARWGRSLSELPSDHPGHTIIASYIAQLVSILQSVMEPGRIILGGGVMSTPGLIERVREDAALLGGGYFFGVADEVVVAPGLGDRSGLMGALVLALSSTS